MKVNNVYIEEKVRNHPNTHMILKRINFQNIIICDNYSEIFNPSNQSFRIQKSYPSFILAKKENNFVKPTPKRFTIGYKNNYYFSHMMNCPYDCKYCYLQGMFNSANYLVFVNYEDFFNEIKVILNRNTETSCFFSGYDCDSLALENITCFTKELVFNLNHFKNGFFELRSKSTNIKVLRNIRPTKSLIPAFSLNPEFIINEYESKTPSLKRRLLIIKRLQDTGWNVGIRFDPVIWLGHKKIYKIFFSDVFSFLDIKKIHSITIGNFRIPVKYLKKLSKIRPNDSFIQMASSRQSLGINDNSLEHEGMDFCKKEILKFIDKNKVFEN